MKPDCRLWIQTVYVKGPNGKVIVDERTPWDDYQVHLQARREPRRLVRESKYT